jgi:hypothetical protein
MSAGKDWTGRELGILKHALADGLSITEIAPLLPARSVKAIDNMTRRQDMGRGPQRYAKPVALPPIPIAPEVLASEQLRVATIQAIMRYANDNAVDVDTAAYRLLSKGVA